MKGTYQVAGWIILALGASAFFIYILKGNWTAATLAIVLSVSGRALLGFAEVLASPLLRSAIALANNGRTRASISFHFLASLTSRLGFAAFCIGVLWYFLHAKGPPPWAAAALAWTIAGAPFYWAATNGSPPQNNIDYPAANIGLPAAALLFLAGIPLPAASMPLIALFVGSAILITVRWAALDRAHAGEQRSCPSHQTSAAAGTATPQAYQSDAGDNAFSAKDAGLTLAQLDHFKRKLLRYRAEVFHEMTQTISDLEAKISTNEWGGASEEVNIEISETRTRYRTLIRKLEAALGRIEDGTYGFSAESGKAIELDLLEKNPVVERTREEHNRFRRSVEATAGSLSSTPSAAAASASISNLPAAWKANYPELPVAGGDLTEHSPLVITASTGYVDVEYAIIQLVQKTEPEWEFKFKSQALLHKGDRVIDAQSYYFRKNGATAWEGVRKYFFDITAGFGN